MVTNAVVAEISRENTVHSKMQNNVTNSLSLASAVTTEDFCKQRQPSMQKAV